MPEKKRTCLTDKEKLRIIENSRKPGFIKKKCWKIKPLNCGLPIISRQFCPDKKIHYWGVPVYFTLQCYLPEIGFMNPVDSVFHWFSGSHKKAYLLSIPRKSCNRKCYSEQTWWPLDNSQLLVEGERDGPELGLVHFEVFFVEWGQ